LRSIFIFLLIIISCSEIDNKNIKVQVPIPTSINSLFNEKPEIIKLDLTSSSQIESWVQMISFTEKFSDLFDKEINHKSKIKLLSTDLDKIKKETIPGKYKTSPIIGRIRVVNTYLQKIDSYLLNQDNLEEYKIDLENLVESYNGLLFQINLITKQLDN
tara:strand:- start:604 stop:1080 length:477 start_codon:yes stop_codon:yes gene_type:complete